MELDIQSFLGISILKKLELRKASKQQHENWIRTRKKDEIGKLKDQVGNNMVLPEPHIAAWFHVANSVFHPK